MENQKRENLLNLSIGVSVKERLTQPLLAAGTTADSGVWTVIIRYHGNITEAAGNLAEIVPLLGNYAIAYVKEEKIQLLTSLNEVDYMEKPKPLYFI